MNNHLSIMKRLTMHNGRIEDADTHTCHECGLAVGPRATYTDRKVFCSADCAQDYRDRQVVT